MNTESGKFSYKSDKGGSETDYYNVGSGSGKDFSAYANYEIPRGEGAINAFRYIETDESTVSAFHIPGAEGGDLSSGAILEPPGPDTETPNMNQRIPVGQYGVYANKGTDYPCFLHLYSTKEGKGGAFDKRAILQHYGSYPRNTEGCQLTGDAAYPNMFDRGNKAKGIPPRIWQYGVTKTRPTSGLLVNYYQKQGLKTKVNIFNSFK